MEPTCPQCHGVVRPTDFFCYNCGKNLKVKPLPTSLTTEIMYYAGSVLLPPLGFWWGIKYLKQPDAASKRIGILCMVFTTISFIVTSIWLVDYINKINATVNNQLNGLQGF
ncbi:MAG: zinc ribbon domain-containing protein [Candidatus Gottesmanbacteria bacterium]|nr:zinc ribbon domain-containing protein [Candidatus Gottesmanbacteria bacterium]